MAITSKEFNQLFQNGDTLIIKAMPNTPYTKATIGGGDPIGGIIGGITVVGLSPADALERLYNKTQGIEIDKDIQGNE